jgi:hypothetical protein
MYAPITSEINIEIGTVLREISTEQPFTVVERLKFHSDTPGEDTWRIKPADAGSDALSLLLTRRQLSEKYFAEVDADE